jgi:hypothetical protein
MIPLFAVSPLDRLFLACGLGLSVPCFFSTVQ